MYIAQNTRKENIAEYILYIWQLEDLLRALQFSPEAIYSQLIGPRNLERDKEHELLIWYMDLANLLQQEGKEKNGHIDHTMHLIADLQTLHNQLQTLPAGEKYRSIYLNSIPAINELRKILDKEDVGDVEIAFRALYAAMLYRIKNKEEGIRISEEIVKAISPLIAELSHIFRQIERGEKDLFEEKI